MAPVFMLKKAVFVLFTLVVMVFAMAAGGYWWRHELLMSLANNLLGDKQMVLTSLQGLHLTLDHATLTALELQAPNLNVAATDIELNYNLRTLFSTGKLRNLNIGSVVVSHDDDTPVLAKKSDTTSELLFSTLSQQLRTVPAAEISINELRVPQWQQAIALSWQQAKDSSSLALTSGIWHLQAMLDRQAAKNTDIFQLELELDKIPLLALTLTPQATGNNIVLASNGKIQLAQLNTLHKALALSTPLPFNSIELEWDIAATMTDELNAWGKQLFMVGIGEDSFVNLGADQFSGLGELQVQLTDRAELSIKPADSFAINAGVLPLQFVGSWQGEAFSSIAQVTTAQCRLLEQVICALNLDGKAELARWILPQETGSSAPLSFDAVTLAGKARLQFDSNALQLELSPDFQLSSGAVKAGTDGAAGFTLQSENSLLLSTEFNKRQVKLQDAELSATVDQASVGAYRISSALLLHKVHAELSPALSVSLGLQTSALQVSPLPEWLPDFGLEASLGLADDRLSFSGKLQGTQTAAPLEVLLQGRHELSSGSGILNITLTPMTLGNQNNPLSAYLKPGASYPFDMLGGNFSGNAELQWQTAAPSNALLLSSHLNLALTDVTGFYNKVFFAGLNTNLTTTVDTNASQPLTTPPLSLTLASLDIGLPITNLALGYQFDSAAHTLAINTIRGNLLGGSVSSQNILYDFSSDSNLINLDFKGLRLENMLQLADYAGVQADGAVSGHLPLIIRGTEIEVLAGTLAADQPGGLIRYLAGVDAPASGNAGLDLMNQALSNYHFATLSSSINYTPTGELLLSMHMQGSNPDMNNGQLINLNLNLSDNIPALLKSLQTGRDIEDFVQAQYLEKEQ